MNCPYCQNELEAGFIYSSGNYNMIWLEEKKKLGLFYLSAYSQNLNYKKANFSRPKIKSYKCKDCKKMIIDLKEN